MTLLAESKSTVVKAARRPLNHLAPLKNQLLRRAPPPGSTLLIPEKSFRTAGADKQGTLYFTRCAFCNMLPGPPHVFPALHAGDNT